MKPNLSSFLIAGVLSASCTGLVSKEQPVPPNVVFLLVDDLGWTDITSFGSDLYQTPHIDKLIESGVKFTDNYAACTVCSPTRAALMTGKYPARINCTDWIEGHRGPGTKFLVPDWTMYMDTAEFTMAKAFQAAGYVTAHIGKWHLGNDEIYWPENQGFDINIGGWRVGGLQWRDEGCEGYFSPYCNPRLEDGPPGEYLTERLAREAISFIQDNHDKPFFLNLWFYNVHTPLQAKEELIEKYEPLVNPEANHRNPVYAAMVQHVDEAVGKVMQELENQGMLENTIVVFNSDNGGLIGRGNIPVTSNVPLRLGKGNIYEGAVRVPGAISFPGRIPAGIISDELVISMDFYPTLMELAGIDHVMPENIILDGVSLAPLLEGKKDNTGREAIYWHYPHYHIEGAVPYSAIRKGQWKLLHIIEDNSYELYNLDEDIGETINLALEMPEKARELIQDLEEWKTEVQAQMPIPNPDWDGR